MRFWIDRHNLTVVARDGLETNWNNKNLTVQFLTVAVGQRIDVILQCSGERDTRYSMFSAVAFFGNTTLPFATAYLTYGDGSTHMYL